MRQLINNKKIAEQEMQYYKPVDPATSREIR